MKTIKQNINITTDIIVPDDASEEYIKDVTKWTLFEKIYKWNDLIEATVDVNSTENPINKDYQFTMIKIDSDVYPVRVINYEGKEYLFGTEQLSVRLSTVPDYSDYDDEEEMLKKYNERVESILDMICFYPGNEKIINMSDDELMNDYRSYVPENPYLND